jgi:hypothetical protein
MALVKPIASGGRRRILDCALHLGHTVLSHTRRGALVSTVSSANPDPRERQTDESSLGR